jgi:hypothetical protein
MNRRKWLWTALMAVPLAVAGGLVYATGALRTATLVRSRAKRCRIPIVAP